MKKENKTIALALSGGGARGIAHIGFLKALHEAGIGYQYICGTSFGGLVGAALAVGITLQDLEKEALRISKTSEFIRLLDPNPLRRGFLEGNRVKAYIEKLIGSKHEFESLKIPLTLIAVDLATGTEVLLNSGDLLNAVFATIAIPGIFNPVEFQGKMLVDGGVLNNLPVNHARATGADLVIAVNVHPRVGSDNPWDYSRTSNRLIPASLISMYRAEIIQSNWMTRINLINHPPNVLVHPDIPDEIDSLFGFRYAKEILKAGDLAAKEAIPSIFALLENHT
jgi:NTE family protein